MEYNFQVSWEEALCNKVVELETRSFPCSSVCCMFLGAHQSGYPECPQILSIFHSGVTTSLCNKIIPFFVNYTLVIKKIKNCILIHGSFP